MILVCTDGTELSDKAIVTAASLSKQLGTKLIVITVSKALGSERAKRALEEAKETAEKLGATCQTEEVVGTEVPEAILKTVKEKDVRFIVMASRGLGTVGSLFIGSTTQQVLAQADRPVLVVR